VLVFLLLPTSPYCQKKTASACFGSVHGGVRWQFQYHLILHSALMEWPFLRPLGRNAVRLYCFPRLGIYVSMLRETAPWLGWVALYHGAPCYLRCVDLLASSLWARAYHLPTDLSFLCAFRP
jgi:hypothetical protein